MTSQTPPVAGAVVTVPVEPTEAMLDAGFYAFNAADGHDLTPGERLSQAWEAMLSAAPHRDPVPPVVARHIEEWHEDSCSPGMSEANTPNPNTTAGDRT